MTEERELRTYPFSPYPDGWYVLANSHEIGTGCVKSFHYFGRDIVIYRTENCRAHVVDAYCPHLGAHLGTNGAVIGNNLRCPFHYWQFDEQGKCVHVPYADPQPKACLKRWKSIERNGQIITYFSANGSPPSYQIPEIDELNPGTRGWSKSHFGKFEYRSHIQEVVENVVDLGHFVPVHSAKNVPEIKEVVFDGPFASMSYTTKMKIFGKIFKTDMKFKYYGPAYAVVAISGMMNIRLVVSLTPVNEHKIRHRFHFKLEKVNPLINVFLAFIMSRRLEQDMWGDVSIWENKIHLDSPMLCKGEGNIMKMRNWFRQFYPEAD